MLSFTQQCNCCTGREGRVSGWIWEGREGGLRRWDGLKEGEWVEMGRAEMDMVIERHTTQSLWNVYT